MKTAALIEFNSWHSETLYSQILYLKHQGYTVHLICNSKLKNQIADITVADHTLLETMSLSSLFRVRRYLIRNKVDKVIINTAQGDKALKFSMLPFPKRITFTGVLHDLRKLTHSGGQKRIMKKIKRYFVLARFMETEFPTGLGLSGRAMSPCFLPGYPDTGLAKPDNEIWIVIPGSIELSRRDYMALFQDGAKYAPHVKFILLGNSAKFDGPMVKAKIDEMGLQDNFISFDGFVPNDVYYSYARRADYAMLLIHEDTTDFEGYLKHKITGTLLTALSLKKPMLADIAFANLDDYKERSLFYKRSELNDFVNSLEHPDPQKYYGKRFDEIYSLNAQAENYVSFIEKE